MPIINGEYRRPELRNDKINYRYGWFFVTFQVEHNKSELGAIVGEECRLNELGKRVEEIIKTLGDYNREVFVDTFVVMPNHVHIILKIEDTPTNSEHHLGKIIGKLKSLAAREYRLLKNQGLARDIGSKLWQANYWEKIVTNYEQLEAIRKYIATNPKNWSMDRFGPVTTYMRGNQALLNEPFVAYVESDWRGAGHDGPEITAGRDGPAPQDKRPRTPRQALQDYLGERGCYAPPIISTFTSSGEREVLRSLIAEGRRFIGVYPGGVPAFLPSDIRRCVEEGRALLMSPVEPGTGVNKQRAIWCNEYIIRRAKRVVCGYIKPGGSLETILSALKISF